MDLSAGNSDILAKALRGRGRTENGVCTVIVDREDIDARIGNKPLTSLHHMFNFEPADENGNSLITGEMVLLENEVYPISNEITNAGIIVGAIHNHWLFDEPKLIYIQVEAVMNPATFANKVSRIINR